MKLLVEINKTGTTVIVVTHEHDLVKEFGGRIIIIDDGEIKSDKKYPARYHETEADKQ